METAVNLGWTASKNETTFGIGCKVFTNFKSWFHELFSLLLLTNDFFSSLLWKRMPSFVLRSTTVLKLDLVINISSVMVSHILFWITHPTRYSSMHIQKIVTEIFIFIFCQFLTLKIIIIIFFLFFPRCYPIFVYVDWWKKFPTRWTQTRLGFGAWSLNIFSFPFQVFVYIYILYNQFTVLY